MSEFERIIRDALQAAARVPCGKAAYVDGLEEMLKMLKEDLAAARDQARAEERSGPMADDAFFEVWTRAWWKDADDSEW